MDINKYKNLPISQKEIMEMESFTLPYFEMIAKDKGISLDEIKTRVTNLLDEIKKQGEFSTFDINTQERIKFRENIINQYIHYFSPDVRNRDAIIIIGPPASGKSTLSDKLILDLGCYTILDSDIMRTGLKDFEGLKYDFDYGRGELKIYKELSFIMNEITTRTIKEGRNLIIPKVGLNKQQIVNIATSLKENNYSTTLILVDLPIAKSAARNISRFLDGCVY